jgi:hypothetical protein
VVLIQIQKSALRKPAPIVTVDRSVDRILGLSRENKEKER